MPSLRNRKGKGRLIKVDIDYEPGNIDTLVKVINMACKRIDSEGWIEEQIDKYLCVCRNDCHCGDDSVRVEISSTIDDYVKGCFGCGAKTEDKYCGEECLPWYRRVQYHGERILDALLE